MKIGVFLEFPIPRYIFCLLLFFLFPFSSLAVQTSPAAFESANQLYFQGKYSDAATTYGILEQSGQKSAALYFNWGNALFKSGQIGRAIAAYRQAQALAPRDPDIRANLEFARKQRQGPAFTEKMSRQWLQKLTPNEWATLAGLSVWIFFGALALLQWRPALIRGAKPSLTILGAATLTLCVLAVEALRQSRGEPVAIVTVADAAVRNGWAEESPTAFTVHDGAELAVRDRKNDWLQVEVDGGQSGWIKKDQVALAL